MGIKRKEFNKKSLMYKIIILVLSLLIAFFSFIFGFDSFNNYFDSKNAKYYNSPVFVSFIDVEQGDCALFSCKGINILVDGGEREFSYDVINYLNSLDIDTIDCYVLTHPHSDHIGAAADIIRTFNVKKILTTYFSEKNIPTTKTYEDTLLAIKSAKTQAEAVEAGDIFNFGEVKLEIIAPICESEDYNEMSIVFTASYKDFKVLFTGDTTKNVEEQIIDKNFDIASDIIKIAHHGSSSSTSKSFLDLVSPKFAVISCGFDNSYGHPHKEVITLLKDSNINTYRTDLEGTIVFFGNGYTFDMVNIL